MANFIPSFIQKRILRYALVRLDLLETDSLELEKLDIAWGRSSTIELKEVAIRTDRLSTLLRLPRYISVTEAKIQNLKITVPADLYRSSIFIELHEIKIRTVLSEEDKAKRQEPTPGCQNIEQSDIRRQADSETSQSDQIRVHDPGGVTKEEIAGDSTSRSGHGDLPTTQDLAQSFLQSQSPEKRDELQAAVTQSQILSQSVTSDGSALEASDVGVGNALSIPAFLADFLQGIGDRLKVRLEDITVDFVFDIETSPDGPSKSRNERKSEDVVVRLKIGSLNIGEAMDEPLPSKHPSAEDISTQKAKTKRRLSLQNLQAQIITAPSVFSCFAQDNSPPSPGMTRSNTLWHAQARSSGSPSTQNSKTTIEDLSMSVSDLRNMASQDVLAGASFKSYNTARSESLANTKYPPGLNLATQGDLKYRAPADSFYSAIEDREESSGTAKRDLPSPGAQMSSLSAPSLFHSSHPQRTALNDGLFSDREVQDKWIQGHPGDQPDDYGARSLGSVAVFGKEVLNTEQFFQELPSPSSSENDLSTSPSENLEASQFFSHEQATSMYMSALSTDHDEPQGSLKIPGAWSPSHTENEMPQGAASPESRVSQAQITRRSKESLSERNVADQDNAPLPYSTTFNSEKAGSSRSGNSSSPNAEETPYLIGSEPSASDLSRRRDPPRTPAGRSQNTADTALIRKTILDIDRIRVDILDGQFLAEDLSTLFDSSHPASTTNPTSGSVQVDTQASPYEVGDLSQHSSSQVPPKGPATIVSVTAGTLAVNTDLGLIRMMLLILGKTKSLSSMSETTAAKVSKDSATQASLHKVAVSNLSLRLLDRVEEQSAATPDPTKSPGSSPYSDYQEPDVLLACRLSNIRVSHFKTGYGESFKGSVTKFSFGYADDAILAFRSGVQVKDPARDMPISVNDDITFKIVKLPSTVSIDVATQPLLVTLNLQKLDEVFAWVGGFSGIMSLGSSMASTITMLDTTTKKSGFPNRTRTVHFDEASQDHLGGASTAAPQLKITARVGGLIFDLQGIACSLKLETTAVKAVSRAEGIGLQVDRVSLRGPFKDGMDSKNSIIFQLSNARIEYLATPKEVDLSRLLAMLSPSKEKYDRDDDILIDTLLRQRRKAGVVRATIEKVYISMTDPQDLGLFPLLGEELKKLSTVTKYLPEDDRPGLLTLVLIRSLEAKFTVSENFGSACLTGQSLEVAHVTFPTLLTMGLSNLTLSRNGRETFIRKDESSGLDDAAVLPMVMVRFIGNEMEPTVKLKLQYVQFEYHVLPLMALFGLQDADAAERMGADIASSIATLTTPKPAAEMSPNSSDDPFSPSESLTSTSKGLGVRVQLSNSSIALNPYKFASQALLVLSDAEFQGSMLKQGQADAVFSVKKATLMVVDDQNNLLKPTMTNMENPKEQIEHLESIGFVTVCRISSAHVKVQILNTSEVANPSIDVDVRDDLFVLETCADSTQTLIQIFSGLTPPLPKSHKPKYQTEVVPVQDMLSSFTGATFPVNSKASFDGEADPLSFDEGDMMDDDVPQNLEFVSSFYDPDPDAASLGIADSMLEDDLASLARPPVQREIGDKNTLQSFVGQSQIAPGNQPLNFKEDHFGSTPDLALGKEGKGSIGLSQDASPQGGISIRVRDVHIIWNLFDGYDWKRTRDTISQAVAEVENKATERIMRSQKAKGLDLEDEPDKVIGDFLFNSIYIGIPSKGDPTDLTRHVNANIDDLYSETGSESTSRPASSPGRSTPKPQRRRRSLRLVRSKHHKMTFELKGVSSDISIFPPGIGEVETSVDLRVHDLDIFDHVPTSTWKKFATYMRDAGERESGLSQVHIQIQNVRPVPNLSATEIILKLAVLPLRLHVDQDALDFMARFFEFRDGSELDQSSQSDAPFIQRAEVKAIRIRLDFKPKRVDYAGIRSGRTNEFMNFFVLDGADMVLRHVIIYGVSGFDRLGKTLNDIWMPDVKRNQLPGVLAGLAPVRSLVNVGSGVRDLVVVPIREYRKDGRIVRSFQKGAVAFAKTTTSEVMRLGAKLAIGTQTVLQGAEDLLSPRASMNESDNVNEWEDADLEETENKKISLYADQPVGVIQGFRGAYASLERDLLTAKDAIVAMPGEILESDTATDVAKAVWKRAPTVILRPAMGVSKAVGQTLMGATNSLDSDSRRRIEDKYKRH